MFELSWVGVDESRGTVLLLLLEVDVYRHLRVLSSANAVVLWAHTIWLSGRGLGELEVIVRGSPGFP